MRARLLILGTSAAVPMRGRGLPCYVLSYRGVQIILDAGDGCQHRLLEAGVSLHRVEALLLTHSHGDHVYGVPGLLHTMHMNGRSRSLTVVGPRDVLDYIEAALRSTGKPRFELRLVEARDGLQLSLGGLRVRVFPVDHTVEAVGYVVEEPGPKLKVNLEKLRRLGLKPGPYLSKLKMGEEVTVNGVRVRPEDVLEPAGNPLKLVYTGDTRPCERTVREAANATILVHDATFTVEHADKAREEGHSTAADAARVASEAGATLLVLTHFSARYEDVSRHVREARRYHPYVVAAEDYMTIPLA